MRHYQKEIIITILCLVLAGGFISYFFQFIKWEKAEIKQDVYTFIPPSPDALLRIQQSDIWLKHIVNNDSLQKLFEQYIPKLYFELFRKNPAKQILFSFHSEGVICYLPATPHEANRFRSGLAQLLNTYPPHILEKQGTNIYYYADKNNQFIGCFYISGFWISSYNKVLLENVLSQILPTTTENRSAKLINMPNKSTLNLLIPSDKLPLQVIQNDSAIWKNNNEWISADIYNSKGHLSAFFDFPVYSLNDTSDLAVIDSLHRQICHYLHLPDNRLSVQYSSDNKNLYITLTYPATNN